MDKTILKRLEKLEEAHPDPLLLEVKAPKNGTKAMRVTEYMELPEPLDFRVVSGDDGLSALCDAGLLRWHIFRSVMAGKRFPEMKSNGGLAAEDCIFKSRQV